MASNLKLDDALVDETLKISGKRTKKDAVNLAMSEYIAYHRRLKLLELRGQIDFDPDYDYKAQRNKA